MAIKGNLLSLPMIFDLGDRSQISAYQVVAAFPLCIFFNRDSESCIIQLLLKSNHGNHAGFGIVQNESCSR
jgi:hypothetical protein